MKANTFTGVFCSIRHLQTSTISLHAFGCRWFSKMKMRDIIFGLKIWCQIFHVVTDFINHQCWSAIPATPASTQFHRSNLCLSFWLLTNHINYLRDGTFQVHAVFQIQVSCFSKLSELCSEETKMKSAWVYFGSRREQSSFRYFATAGSNAIFTCAPAHSFLLSMCQLL